MQKIKEDVKEIIKTDNVLLGKLMQIFDRGQNTMNNWLRDDDIRFTTPQAVEAIKLGTGLTESEIFETVESEAGVQA